MIQRGRERKRAEGRGGESVDFFGSSMFSDKYKEQRGFLNSPEDRSSNCIGCLETAWLSFLYIEK